MPDKYILVPDAQLDRKSIWRHIAQDNRNAADRVNNQFREAFEKLAEFPYMGHTREDLTLRPLRFSSVHSYLIVYKPDTKPLQILRIISVYRDIAELLR